MLRELRNLLLNMVGKPYVSVGKKAANVVAPVVGFGKGVLKPAGSFSERVTNGIVGGAKEI